VHGKPVKPRQSTGSGAFRVFGDRQIEQGIARGVAVLRDAAPEILVNACEGIARVLQSRCQRLLRFAQGRAERGIARHPAWHRQHIGVVADHP
jgi:hypothetical protein